MKPAVAPERGAVKGYPARVGGSGTELCVSMSGSSGGDMVCVWSTMEPTCWFLLGTDHFSLAAKQLN